VSILRVCSPRPSVVRVAGSVLDDAGAVSLEYAVNFLGVRLVLMLGRRNCGKVDAATDTSAVIAAIGRDIAAGHHHLPR